MVISTVRRTLKTGVIQNHTGTSKLYLSPKNMKARFEWAKLHENCDDEQWVGVSVCEESSFTPRLT